MTNSTKFIRQQAFDIYRVESATPFHSTRRRLIDTVFYAERPQMSIDEVRRELIDHDGYPADIEVRRAK